MPRDGEAQSSYEEIGLQGTFVHKDERKARSPRRLCISSLPQISPVLSTGCRSKRTGRSAGARPAIASTWRGRGIAIFWSSSTRPRAIQATASAWLRRGGDFSMPAISSPLPIMFDAVRNCATSAEGSAFNIVDAGCGEGYYLDRLGRSATAGPQAGTLALAGIDVSKWAVKAAARREVPATWLVANNRIPPFLGEASIWCCACSGFRSGRASRVQKPGGQCCSWIPRQTTSSSCAKSFIQR